MATPDSAHSRGVQRRLRTGIYRRGRGYAQPIVGGSSFLGWHIMSNPLLDLYYARRGGVDQF